MVLGFEEPLEREFQREYFRQSLPIVRVGLVLGALLYFLFVFLDGFMLPLSPPPSSFAWDSGYPSSSGPSRSRSRESSPVTFRRS